MEEQGGEDGGDDWVTIPDDGYRPAPEDPDGERAREAETLDPTLSLEEKERRRMWLAVPASVRVALRQLHVDFHHPTNATLTRILRRRGAKPEVMRAVGLLRCDACSDSIRRRAPRPARLPGKYQFNYAVQLGTFHAHDAAGTPFFFLNVICEGTSFQVVSCLGPARGIPTSAACARAFTSTWTSWAGYPQKVTVDLGKEWMKEFGKNLQLRGVQIDLAPL